MKALILALLLPLGVVAQDSPYIGAALSASTADGDLVSCRASSTLLGGIKFSDADFTFSIEGRSMNSFNGSYASTSAFVKPEYKGVYGLAGYGRTRYTEHDLVFEGLQYGLGYDFGIKAKHLFVDVIYKQEEKDFVLTTGFIYMFEGF